MMHARILLPFIGLIAYTLGAALLAAPMHDEESAAERSREQHAERRTTTITRSSDGGETVVIRGPGTMISADGNVVIMSADGPSIFTTAGGAANGPFMTFSSGGHSMPGQLPELLRPEFLRRDARLYEETLQLHRDQLPIIRLLLESYGEEFEEAAADLRAAIDRRRRSRILQLTGGLPLHGGGDDISDTIAEIAMPAMRAARAAVDVVLDDDAAASADAGEAVVAVRVMRTTGGPVPDGAGGESATSDLPPITVALSLSSRGTADLQIDAEELAALTDRINERMRLARQRAEEARARLEAEGPAPTAAEVHAMAVQFRAKREELAERFRDDLSLIIADWQQELLDAAHELQRLDAQLPHGRLGGESLDLRTLLAQIAPQSADAESLAATLAPWISDTAQMIAERMRRAIDLELAELRHEADSDAEREPQHARTLSLARNLASTRGRIAAHTEEMLQSLLHMVNETDASSMLREARRRAFPVIFRPSQVLSAYDDALALTKDQEDPALHDTIAAMRSEYERRLIAFNERLVAVTRDSDLKQMLLPYELRVREAALRSADDAAGVHEAIQALIHEAHGAASAIMTERTSAAMQAIDHLRSLLGNEQFDQLRGAALLPALPRRQ